ncbi:MAG: PEP/pyruvate-binding domain-containing protein [Cyclobacteriaceae bacterium]
MKRLVFVLAFIVSAKFAFSQIVYSGHIYDAGTGLDVSGASITLVNKPDTVTSNSFGDFVLKYGVSEESSLQFFHNSMFWDGEKPLNIKIASLDSRSVISDKINSSETYLLPRLKTGMYIMQVSDGESEHHYKLLSDGVETVKVDKRGIFHSGTASGQNDTIRIEKEGYYPRELVVQKRSKVLDIAMLKGDYENLHYFNELVAPVAFDIIAGKPARSNLGDVQQVKLVYDIKRDELYYMNSKKYSLHLDFAVQVLGFDKGHFYFNQTQYTENAARRYFLASLNYYQGIDKYVLQFVTAVEMNCGQVELLYDKILNTSFLERKNISFFPIKQEWEACTQVEQISSEELYQGQNYQGMNLAENYGYLRKVSAADLEHTYVGRRDIVLTDGVPNDLPVVAGIITSEFQTPLSHINVLSHSRNTPNMALREAWQSEEIAALSGKLVYLNVKAEGYELREASLAEAEMFWREKEPQETVVLEKNTTYNQLVDMQDANFSFVDRIGGKAANFGELLNVSSVHIPTPENAFAIPFYYYQQHMESYGLDVWIADLIADASFQLDADYRRSMLTKLQDSIMSSPINQNLVSMVREKIHDFRDFNAFRFRSSTNAEDLEEFSGAGLYDSYSAKKEHNTKTIESAISKVWASLWNWRAFEERSYFKIDHLSCAMGILVHRSFPDEDANGVLITKNLYNNNPGFTVNVQYKEYSIVFPEPGIIHDQMILFTWSINPGEEFMLEYLSFSNIPELNGQRVMKDQEVYELGRYAIQIKRRFYYELPHNCDCTFDNFGVDIEFKVDSDVNPRKIYVKQARLYN